MPKFKKDSSKNNSSKKKQNLDENFAYRSVIVSMILAGLFFVASILFNGELITIFMNKGGFWEVIDIIIKVVIILLFFFLMVVSIGNYKELTGKPLDFKLIILMVILSLLQAYKNPTVFAFTFFGLIILIGYLFFIQER